MQEIRECCFRTDVARADTAPLASIEASIFHVGSLLGAESSAPNVYADKAMSAALGAAARQSMFAKAGRLSMASRTSAARAARSLCRRSAASGVIRSLAVWVVVSSALAAATIPDLAQPAGHAVAAAEAPAPSAPLRRLTRLEYANSLRDLFGIEFPFTVELPADGQAEGFDNNGDALALTPLLLESYLKAARKAGEKVLGTGSSAAVTESFRAADAQAGWIEGLPMSTRGGMRISHYFPRDGEYELRAFLDYVLPDGRRISTAFALAPVEGVRSFREKVALTAGLHTVYLTFPDEYSAREGAVPNLQSALGEQAPGGPVDVRGSAIRAALQFWLDGRKISTREIAGPDPSDAALNVQPGPPLLRSLEIVGPLHPAAKVDTPARRRLMVCTPRRAADERGCAARILERVARRAYRRELTAADMRRVMVAFERKRKSATFDEAIGMGLTSILVSPDFLFRVEQDPAGVKAGEVYRIADQELGTRLSYFLWSTLPDEPLLEQGRRGRLKGALLEEQVRRMLADPRADALVDNFSVQWLDLRSLGTMRPDPQVYPEFDDGLAAAFREETRLFLRTIMRENRSVLEVLSSDYTFLNERLARLYGIDGVTGPAFRKVALPADGRRGGVISQASVLMLSSHPAQTSPILRGKWILTNLMNSPPPIPPAGVPALDTAPAADGRKLTTREQIERHRGSPVCAGCHSKMDPYGVALENYDVLGRWRTEENGLALDTTTALPRGEPFTGPAGLKRILLARSDEFVAATVSRLMTYALGRKLEASDRTAVRQIVEAVKPGGYRFADIIVEIVNSAPFQTRQKHPVEKLQS